MIPIKAFYSKGNPKTNVLPKLTSIKIGAVNVKNITEDYLLPVGIQSEKTGVKNALVRMVLKARSDLHKTHAFTQ